MLKIMMVYLMLSFRLDTKSCCFVEGVVVSASIVVIVVVVVVVVEVVSEVVSEVVVIVAAMNPTTKYFGGFPASKLHFWQDSGFRI
jgi:hypothetical protein